MKPNKILFIFFLALTSLTIKAQIIDSVFVNKMPDDFLPTLTKINKLELIEFYKTGQKDTVKNIFRNKVYVVDYDSINHFISIQTAENAKIEIKLFGKSPNNVIGVINTVCGPVCSSYIRFYRNNWTKMVTNIPAWNIADWLQEPDEAVNGVKLTDLFKSIFIELHFDKKTNQMVVKNNSTEFLSVEDRLSVKQFVKNDDKMYNIQISGNEVNIVP